MSVLGEFRDAQANVCGYARRYLEELDALRAGTGSELYTNLAYELLRDAVKRYERVRQQLMTEVGV